uniref:Reverse transcriptase domain-containing protein n=1 Tax=Tanacetum cinerariifolium TaxID=118510 RepID=A0A6L2LJ35_TANCI|nr:hypothetical protein [Tanacetum cinerariifolium]
MDDEPMWAADRVVTSTPGSAIANPETTNEFAIKGNHLILVKGNQFDGRTKTDPHKNIHEFLRIYDMFNNRDTKNEAVRLMMFPLSLTGEANTWLDELNKGTIKTWDELRTAFISRFFPPALTDAWLRMKEMLRNCHGHNLSKDLELINLCFADDLFLFSHGDDKSAKVIMEALDEFKLTSGLVPSLPKSTTYFCNVLNCTKQAILQIMPFEEGRLPVKYLGVPLVPSRLIYKDCKVLIEKVDERINDWKNKSLSIAGRLQLIHSVISSLHVYWASMFVLPSGVLLDIEQRMRGFLWCQGKMRKGKSKVAWEVVCLPKKEGGLGVKRLNIFNKALMSSYIWKLLIRKDSIRLRPLIRKFIWYKLGNGQSVSFWYDNWCSLSPLADLVSTREMYRVGLTTTSKIEWLVSGTVKSFAVSTVWMSIRPRDTLVDWADVVWTHMSKMAGCTSLHLNVYDMVHYIIPSAKRRTSNSINIKLVMAASTCFLWQERNERLFNNNKQTVAHELRNDEKVEEAAVAIPLAAVKENTWAKFGLKRVMLDKGFFLFQFATKEGMDKVMESGPWLIRLVPLILIVWTPNTILKKDDIKAAPVWVKLLHVPIVAYSEIGLSLIMTQIGKPIMLDSYTCQMCIRSWQKKMNMHMYLLKSHRRKTLWSLLLLLFRIVMVNIKVNDSQDDLVEVKKKKTKSKQPRQVEGIRITKPKPNLYYRRVEKGEASKSQPTSDGNGTKISMNTSDKVRSKSPNDAANIVTLANSFSALNDVEAVIDKGKTMDPQEVTNENINESDEDIKEIIMEDDPNANKTTFNVEGASTPIDKAPALLWDGTKMQLILLLLLKMIRRILWNNLGLHKLYVRQRPWCLLGDFNAALFLDDMLAGPASLDIAMREFNDCVEDIEVMDVQYSVLKFTWNQKPKGMDGILKKIDRLMSNLEFNDVFQGAHAIFKPYRISDHAPAVLTNPTAAKVKPKPFKFVNILVHNVRFKEVVSNGWNINVSGFHLFKVVKRLKNLKRPLPKLLYDHGNIHENVKRLRFELDKTQRDLDADPFNSDLRDKEAENDKVADVFITHYEVFLGQAGNASVFNTSNLFGNTLSADISQDMVRNVNNKEDIVGNDVTSAVCEFFTNGKLLSELNHTIIALIPKVSSPLHVTDFRPISCCNVLFKTITKIIANHLKESLKVLVSPNQSAFVPGRSSVDNILLTQEIMHNYHLDWGVPRYAFKVDFQKAYDTVDWDFLKMVLIGFGFHERMVLWIMECVTTTSFSISINGNLHGYFKGKRGLCQGDPLSPYLFTIIMEILTLMIKRQIRDSGSFTYHRHCSKLELVNLCFADDLFLFAHGDVNSEKVIMEALDEFKHASGLTPSLPKSTAYFCNVLNYVKLSILQVLPFEEGRLPIKYLGVPLNKSLSTSGRLQLIQSVVSSLHVYWASVFILPTHILLDIEQIMRGFLWCHGNIRRGMAKVAWEDVYLPKDEGGLGIRRLVSFNQALMDIPMRDNMTWGWRNILRLRPLILEFFWYKIGNGSSALAWFDHWCGLSPLANVISSRDIFRGGFDKHSMVRDLIVHGQFTWPQEWLSKYPTLVTINAPILCDDVPDSLVWKGRLGIAKRFSVYSVWNDLRPHDAKVNWYDIVWFPAYIPRHALNLWLIIRSFAQQVWNRVEYLAGLSNSSPSMDDILHDIAPFAKRRTLKSIVAKLVVAAAAYFIWQERNGRLFKESKLSVSQVSDKILNSVRLKLISCRIKKSRSALELFHRWKISDSIL